MMTNSQEQDEECANLNHVNWLSDLAFLTNFKIKLSLELQGKNNTLIEMISGIYVYKSKFIMLIEDLQQNNVNHFPNMPEHLQKHQKCN